MDICETLIEAASHFIQERFSSGTEGAAAIALEDGQILISTSPPVKNDAVSLCHETGAICEAYKLNKKIIATVCVMRDEKGFHILTPCGVCQERLWSWGGEVICVVPRSNCSTEGQPVKLADLSPHYWRRPFIS